MSGFLSGMSTENEVEGKGLSMQGINDLVGLAGRLHIEMNRDYYVAQLNALLREAELLKLAVVDTPTDDSLPVLAEWALMSAWYFWRRTVLFGKESIEDARVDRRSSLRDGWTQSFYKEMMDTLERLGVFFVVTDGTVDALQVIEKEFIEFVRRDAYEMRWLGIACRSESQFDEFTRMLENLRSEHVIEQYDAITDTDVYGPYLESLCSDERGWTQLKRTVEPSAKTEVISFENGEFNEA